MPRPTKAQQIAREQDAAKLARYQEQEAKRATRMMADTPPVLWALLILSSIALLTSFVFSYFALVEVAVWMRPPQEWLTLLVPGFIELVIVLSALDYVVARSRGESGRTPFWMMIAMSAVAVIGNAAHTFYEWLAEFDAVPWEGWLGVALSAIVPLIVVYISKRITSTVFSEPIVLD
jgi:uncharacterized membrane protein SirB2